MLSTSVCRFTVEENVSSTSQIKNSVQRGIHNQIAEQYPVLADSLDDAIPRKQMMLSRCQDHVQLISVNNEVVFFCERDGPWYPTLRFLHKCKYYLSIYLSIYLYTTYLLIARFVY